MGGGTILALKKQTHKVREGWEVSNGNYLLLMSLGHPGDMFKDYNADPFKIIKIIFSLII